MLSELESEVIKALESGGLSAATIGGGKRNLKGTRFPAALTRVQVGSFEKSGQAGIKWNVTLVVWIGFKAFKSEDERRKGLYPLLEGVVGLLALQTLGLAVDPLRPKRFYNATDDEAYENGIEAFQLEFSTGFTTDPAASAEEAADLLRIALEYYLQDPEDDGQADASDLIEAEG